jgi:hypothetical protein
MSVTLVSVLSLLFFSQSPPFVSPTVSQRLFLSPLTWLCCPLRLLCQTRPLPYICSLLIHLLICSSPSSGYCFLTLLAARPSLCPGAREFSNVRRHSLLLRLGTHSVWIFSLVNWATGLPGVQPKWEGEYSVFVGDLGRDVGEGELVVGSLQSP